MTDEFSSSNDDLVQLLRLALSARQDDVRLFAARLVRRYRKTDPEVAAKLAELLQSSPAPNHRIFRHGPQNTSPENAPPVSVDDGLALLRRFDEPTQEPILTGETRAAIGHVLAERRSTATLAAAGLEPISSLFFVGPPGVGKTLTARWIAKELQLPLHVLDVASVMSSFLGRSGNNLRMAFEFAKSSPSVLLLDEVDAMAKRRADPSDIGELKRMVTVTLQELDAWPATSLVIAATNHPELIDPALWRRFDRVVEFGLPDDETAAVAIESFAQDQRQPLSRWMPVLAVLLRGESMSALEQTLTQLRRSIALGRTNVESWVEELVVSRSARLDRSSRVDLAKALGDAELLSQHRLSSLTGVSRDTIRKHSRAAKKLP